MESYSHSNFETYNAKSLSPIDVAKTFVPPDRIYSDLSSKNNHLLVGPRGSGKTTLFKMLTIPALATWGNVADDTVYPRVDFIGVMIAADRGWHAQLKSSSALGPEGDKIGVGTFTTHVLSSFVRSISDISKYCGDTVSRLERSPRPLDKEQEVQFIKLLAEAWHLDPVIPTLAGLIISLKGRLIRLGEMKKRLDRLPKERWAHVIDTPYIDLTFKDCIIFAIESFEAITGQDNLTWALLFDEFEIAPTEIQREVLSNLRGQSDSRLLFKAALAMYNKNLEEVMSDSNSATVKNDFTTLNLWYPKKNVGHSFSEKLVHRIFEDAGLPDRELSKTLGWSSFGFDDDDEAVNRYANDGKMAGIIISLYKSDSSFQEWADRHGLDVASMDQLSEEERAAKVRKIRSIVLVRQYFRRFSTDGSGRSSGRSRKVEDIFVGYPSLLTVCEGNPRFILHIFSQLAIDLMILRQSHSNIGIPAGKQAEYVRETANAFRAFIKAIRYRGPLSPQGRGLLRIIDRIGEYFYRRCVVDPFSPEPPLTFTVDSNVDENMLDALGKALNAGALIYVPDKNADPILSSLRGKRFRLSYLLAVDNKIPLTLGNSVALSTILSGPILGEENGSPRQDDLFEEERSDVD